jgi:hypothetical protein
LLVDPTGEPRRYVSFKTNNAFRSANKSPAMVPSVVAATTTDTSRKVFPGVGDFGSSNPAFHFSLKLNKGIMARASVRSNTGNLSFTFI